MREAIIVRILKKLKNETSVASIYMFGKTRGDKLGRLGIEEYIFRDKVLTS